MALIDIETEDGTLLGNPTAPAYFIFLDSSNSDRLTLRDSAGVDTVYTAGVIPTVLNDLTDVTIAGPTDGQYLVYRSGLNAWQNVDPPVYGTEAQFWTNPALQQNTTTTPQDVLNVNTTNLPVGTYELTIQGNVSYDASNSDGIVLATFDGSAITGTTGNNEIMRWEPKENGGNNPPGAGTDQKVPLSFTYPVVVGAAGAKNIVVQIQAGAGGVEMNVWNLYVKLIRIA